MNNYRTYELTDFVLDEDFIAWVHEGKSDLFWKNWIQVNPGKQQVIEEARQILMTLVIIPETISEEEVDEEAVKLLNSIAPLQAPIHIKKNNRKWWWAAASVFALLGLGIWIFSLSSQNASKKFSYASLTKAKHLIEQANTSTRSLNITLPDGSTVELAPNSRISYSNDFKDSTTRDIYLLGEAFFKVTRNVKQPFRVFTREIVTKVLGTSFTVRSFDEEKTINVTVRTGKVNVYSQEETTTKQVTAFPDPGGVLLMPNQQAVYKKEEKKLGKKLLEKPVIIVPEINSGALLFEDTPVVKALELIKKAYGVSIVYDADVLKGCTLTADLRDESLYTKLNLLCKAIDAEYEIIDSEIFIHAKGCQ